MTARLLAALCAAAMFVFVLSIAISRQAINDSPTAPIVKLVAIATQDGGGYKTPAEIVWSFIAERSIPKERAALWRGFQALPPGGFCPPVQYV